MARARGDNMERERAAYVENMRQERERIARELSMGLQGENSKQDGLGFFITDSGDPQQNASLQVHAVDEQDSSDHAMYAQILWLAGHKEGTSTLRKRIGLLTGWVDTERKQILAITRGADSIKKAEQEEVRPYREWLIRQLSQLGYTRLQQLEMQRT